MNRMYPSLRSDYGAFELKLKYQRNMLTGTLFAALLVLITFSAIFIYRLLTADEMENVPVQIIKTIADLGPPPSVAKKPPEIKISQPNLVAPKVGIPKPVADDEAVDNDVVIASKQDLADIVAPSAMDTGAGGGIVVDIPQDEYLPAPDEFVPVEIGAEMIYREPPEYPRPAKIAGMEAMVWVKALVDKSGNVVKAMIFKSSGSKAGFDEAAVASAYKCKFKPAIQNGRPVALWVAYQVEFTLRER
ncbi:MAG: TonB family protein [candidate division Zixibacteria bacterium]|nr:TonB family protein [candidate division Zixibacteria bacterium]